MKKYKTKNNSNLKNTNNEYFDDFDPTYGCSIEVIETVHSEFIETGILNSDGVMIVAYEEKPKIGFI